MGKTRLIPFAIAVTLGLSLGVDAAPDAVAAQRGNNACVAVSGGLVSNETVLDVVADGGTAISDASGGQGNIAARASNNRNRNHNNNNRRNRNRRNWVSEPLVVFEARLQTDTASAGNAGVATASANGGAVSIGDINSGGNAGNAISVGDTHCPGAAPSGGGRAGGNAGGGGRGGQVRALPSTGVGTDGASGAALLCALSALGFAGLSLHRRLDLQLSSLGNR